MNRTDDRDLEKTEAGEQTPDSAGEDIPEENKAGVRTQADKKPEKEEKEPREHFTLYKKRVKRTGYYLSSLSDDELNKLQFRKSLFMYLCTLFYALSMFLKVEGRTRLSENKSLFALYSLYVILSVVMLFYTVYIVIMGRTGHKIAKRIRAKYVSTDGLDKHTFVAYELFNALHVLLALAEIAISLYKIGIWGGINVAAALATAVFSVMSRQILYRANAGNLTFVPEEDSAK